jgi:flavin-dependent dehydrogenase
MPVGVTADVLVIGGGPGGCAAAIMLARAGRRVQLIEKDRHPRFHIGESLLPMSMPIFEELGVREAVEARGCIKRGADFPSSTPEGYTVFRFGRSLNPTWPYAVQIRRADLDQILFDAARRAGVLTAEETTAEEVTFGDDGIEVGARTAQGDRVSYRARYVIDASGRETLLGRLLRLKEPNPLHRSAALYAHFAGVSRRDGEDAGNISIYRVADGWAWVIPLPEGITSVGLVCGPDTLRMRGGDSGGFLRRTLESNPQLAARLAGAELVGHLQATGNYSYQCRAWAGHRWVMVGDAAAFLDPIFSSGVHLALQSALDAAQLVDRVLTAPQREARLQRQYSATQRAALRRISWFIVRFNTPVMRQLFSNPRNDWRLEDAVISMLAGDFYRSDRIGWRLRAFKLLYWVSCLLHLRAAIRGVIQLRRRQREAFL